MLVIYIDQIISLSGSTVVKENNIVLVVQKPEHAA